MATLPQLNYSRPRSGRSVSIQGNLVIKVQEPRGSRRERLRTQAGAEVGRATGLFQVPRIVSFDDSRGEISFERLPLQNLRQVLSQGSQGAELLERVGQALGAIHSRMQPIEGATAQPSARTEGRERLVPIQGDFGVRNVFWLAEARNLAIIDWSNADWTGVEADLAEPEIDLGVFLISLIHRRILGPWPLRGRHELARRFLGAYAAASPYGIEVRRLREVVAGMTPAFVRLTRSRKGALHSLGCRHSMTDLHWFLRRYSNPG